MLSPSFVLGVGFVILTLFSSTSAQTYVSPDIYTPSSFFSRFNFVTEDDPTHGYVEYVALLRQTSFTSDHVYLVTYPRVMLRRPTSLAPARVRSSSEQIINTL